VSNVIPQLAQWALLGTERQPANLSADDPLLKEFFTQLGTQPAESQLLGAAGAAFLYQRAGRVPGVDVIATPEPASAETLLQCSARAGGFLREMVGGKYSEVLPEWLAACAASRKRIAHEDLPALLELGRKKNEWRSAILQVIGQRGIWLGAQNPDWSYVAGAAEEESIWETGTSPARLMWLQQLRKRDANRARDLLGATWKQEAPEDRASFLATFEYGLSAADENFLESALDDKRKEVRQIAAGLLAQLPESRLCQRMIERMKPLVKFMAAEKGSLLKLKGGRKAKLEITLPTACDKAMMRDGIDSRKQAGIGEKAGWLQQIIESVPISFWGKEWQTTPAELIATASIDKEWRTVLLGGWASAAVRAENADWAEALLLEQVEKKTLLKQAGPLLKVLPRERREACLFAALQSDLNMDVIFSEMLTECRDPWSREFSRILLKQIKELAKTDNWSVRGNLAELGRNIDPIIIDEMSAGWPEDGKHWNIWSGAVEQFMALVQFRHDMLEAIKSN
jgi:Family of unknown function (DUF5691)